MSSVWAAWPLLRWPCAKHIWFDSIHTIIRVVLGIYDFSFLLILFVYYITIWRTQCPTCSPQAGNYFTTTHRFESPCSEGHTNRLWWRRTSPSEAPQCPTCSPRAGNYFTISPRFERPCPELYTNGLWWQKTFPVSLLPLIKKKLRSLTCPC